LLFHESQNSCWKTAEHFERADVLTERAFRDTPELSQYVFDRLLAWLDDGTASHGERYLEMRRRLVSYFDRRNRPAADELADETLNRVARALEHGGEIAVRPPARYCYIVARFVLFEDVRRERHHVGLDESTMNSGRAVLADLNEDYLLRERRLDCLDRCLDRLKPEQRTLIVEYYRDAGRQKIDRRRALADRLGISMNALAIRTSRIRDTLLACMVGCRGARRRY
jgi:DNA-directed RNA polymerase specialized sigma24 family protein